ncbi:MAG: IGHMBP2 family helicase [Planctomycetes bacterium]|nr:IGHMBP2 family helicase [Planctomycetota bacterium]
MPTIHLEPLSRRVGKSDLLALLESVGGLDRQRVGRIELQGGSANIEVPEGWHLRLARALDGQWLGDRRIRAWADSPASSRAAGEDHFQRLGRLLDVESHAEAQQALERARRLSPAEAERCGSSLNDLAITEEDSGLGGRYLLQLSKRNRAPLPWTVLDVGSPVVLSPQAKRPASGYRGVVYRRTEHTIHVALGSMPDSPGDHETWRLDLADDEVALQRQRSALQRARVARGDRTARLRDVLVGERPPEFSAELEVAVLNRGLNQAQQHAVRFAMSARDVALLHGPPGTGKTTAVVELIRQAVRRGERVLACAPSNLAVDNIFQRLIAWREKAVRLGHPARVLPELREHTLDLLVESHPDVRLARKLVKQAMTLFRQASRYTRAKPEPGERGQTRREARELLADARRLEMQAVEHILDTADVLCATTTGLDSEILGTRHFDLAVIDEACQSVEPGCWIPLLRCDRVVLAGDHCQLPPTVVSREAAAEGLGVSLFERLMDLHGASISRRLSVQYRMHESIMDFSSAEFYDAELVADDSVRKHCLADLPGVSATPLTVIPVEFIDTAGASFDEDVEADGESRWNRQEGELVARKAQQLMDAGLPPGDIAVIAPYAAQVRFLRERLPVPGLEIDSVDGFQGREKEAVVISLVRSNPRGDIGFLSDVRRMNVAMTRARRKLLMIGDSATLCSHPFYQRAIEYFESLGAYRTVWEEDV